MAVTGTIGAGDQPGVHRARILLYDKDGKPLAEIPCASNTSMENITFGPDGMIYTAESWFGAGAHVYDRPGGKNRHIEKRHLRADGSHVDRGSPSGIAVTTDGRRLVRDGRSGPPSLVPVHIPNKRGGPDAGRSLSTHLPARSSVSDPT